MKCIGLNAGARTSSRFPKITAVMIPCFVTSLLSSTPVALRSFTTSKDGFAQLMKLYLIRHGETVDNVAGLYAGRLDSALTNFGVDQTKRLGQYFAENNVIFSDVFASPLSRASRTAEAIRNAQVSHAITKFAASLEIVKVGNLVERDYGPYEGKPFASRSQWSKKTADGGEESTGGVESAVALAKRCDNFLDQHLLPLFDQGGCEDFVIAVVAHGMLLSHLWRRLLLRLPAKSLIIDPEIIAAKGEIVPEHLGGWSNTGYLELSLEYGGNTNEATPLQADASSDDQQAATLPTPVPPPIQPDGADISVASPRSNEPRVTSQAPQRTLSGWSTTVLAIDSRKHLYGLKRQKGGIGSLANSPDQKKVDSFFKPLKLA